MSDRLEEDRVPGLAAERTGLAWNRSGLALVVCVGVLARRFFPLETRADHVLAFLLLGGGGVGWAVGLLIARRDMTRRVEPARRVRLVTASTVAVALGAFVLGFFPPG